MDNKEAFRDFLYKDKVLQHSGKAYAKSTKETYVRVLTSFEYTDIFLIEESKKIDEIIRGIEEGMISNNSKSNRKKALELYSIFLKNSNNTSIELKVELSKVTINNFKSLDNFELNFSDFICLIGLNGSGKSTILQAIDFISQQMKGYVNLWLEDRGWEAKDIGCKLTSGSNITSKIFFTYGEEDYSWEFSFNRSKLKCTFEEIVLLTDGKKSKILFKVDGSEFWIQNGDKKINGHIIQHYEGSFLSSIESKNLPKVLIDFKSYIQNIYSLDLLSPQELRKRSTKDDKVALTGNHLSGFLNTFNTKQKENLLSQLKKYYTNLNEFNIVTSNDGSIKLEISENFKNKKLVTEAKYLNDGILRLITILAQLETEKSFLLFDEIENGINSELVELLLDSLIGSEHQVMITTHSPMILNYIEDDIALKSVQYIYKTKEGFTRSIPFFDIPSMREKLEMMGAGSVYVDTSLDELIEEIEMITQRDI